MLFRSVLLNCGEISCKTKTKTVWLAGWLAEHFGCSRALLVKKQFYDRIVLAPGKRSPSRNNSSRKRGFCRPFQRIRDLINVTEQRYNGFIVGVAMMALWNEMQMSSGKNPKFCITTSSSLYLLHNLQSAENPADCFL